MQFFLVRFLNVRFLFRIRWFSLWSSRRISSFGFDNYRIILSVRTASRFSECTARVTNRIIYFIVNSPVCLRHISPINRSPFKVCAFMHYVDHFLKQNSILAFYLGRSFYALTIYFEVFCLPSSSSSFLRLTDLLCVFLLSSIVIALGDDEKMCSAIIDLAWLILL